MVRAMGFYADRVLPRVVNVACGSKASAPLRERVCVGLAGDVVEIGFGSGHNVPFYPAALTKVVAVEPADLAWQLAATRVAASPCAGRAGRPRRAGPAVPGRQLRPRAVDLDPVHHP